MEPPPPGSRIVMTTHDAGVALDFLLPEDDRLRRRRWAWRTFETGVFLLLAALGFYIADTIVASASWALGTLTSIFLVVGIITLISAAHQSSSALLDTGPDDDLLRLSIDGDTLVRTTRAHGESFWKRGDILHLRAEPGIGVILELRNGDRVMLRRGEDADLAELEWIASAVNEALRLEAVDWKHGIQADMHPPPETHIM